MNWLITIITILGCLVGLNVYTDYEVNRTESAYPDTGQYIEIFDAPQYYFEAGNEKDTTLILLHGVGGSSSGWLKCGILKSLARNYHVFAFDRAGHGFSERPEGMGGDPREQAEVLHEAFSRLGIERPVIIGLSWGASVAITYAVQYPDDLSILILIAPYILPNKRAVDIIYPIATVPWISDALLQTLAVPISKLIRKPLSRHTFSPESIPEYYWGETILLSQRPEAIKIMADDMQSINPALTELSKQYGNISVPVSILIGEKDVYFGDDPIQFWADSLGWRYEEIPEAGHAIQYTRSQEVIHSIRRILDSFQE
ncbi:alpha/beta fold hydrolase [Calditrichota bacterium]